MVKVSLLWSALALTWTWSTRVSIHYSAVPSKLPTSVTSTKRQILKMSTVAGELESMTVRELCDWLEKNELPAEYSEKFEGSVVYFRYGTRQIMLC